jgi:hypothetical protein
MSRDIAGVRVSKVYEVDSLHNSGRHEGTSCGKEITYMLASGQRNGPKHLPPSFGAFSPLYGNVAKLLGRVHNGHRGSCAHQIILNSLISSQQP